MFILSLRYVRPLDEVEALLADHVEWLKANHAAGYFLAWGRKVPREGGVIFARVGDRAQAEALAASDPFVRGGVAEVDVIEFAPSFTAPGLEVLAG